MKILIFALDQRFNVKTILSFNFRINFNSVLKYFFYGYSLPD
jgi:hypothetical protein